MERTSSNTLTNVSASTVRRQRIASRTDVSFVSLLAKIVSIRKRGSCGVNSRLIKRSQAEVLRLRKKKEPESGQCRGGVVMRVGGRWVGVGFARRADDFVAFTAE